MSDPYAAFSSPVSAATPTAQSGSDPYAAFSSPQRQPNTNTAGPQRTGYGLPAQAPAQPIRGGVGMDIANSAMQGANETGRGMVKQAANFAGLPFDPASLLQGVSRGVSKAADAVGLPSVARAADVLAGAPAYKPQTTAGEFARTAGQIAPAALLAPGSIGQRAANIAVPTITTELAGRGAKAMGANDAGVEVARALGGVGGGLLANARIAPRPRVDPALEAVARNQDPAALAAKAEQYRSAGIEPTLADLVDDSGRGVIRAAASRMTPGRQAATDFRDASALDLPSRISAQARRVMSDDARTPDQIREATAASRRTNADASFSAVRDQQIQMPPETIQALRNPLGRDAIAEAARRERSPEVRAALNRLHTDALDAPDTPISIGMADRISRTLYGRAQAAARAGDNDLAATFNQLADDVRSPARNASQGYGDALQGYAADSRLHEAAGVGEGLTTRNTDEFVRQAAGLSPEERQLALAAGRRAIERKAGENPSAAPGVARQLADAPEQQARNRALLGNDAAQKLQDAMRLEELSVRNANDIAPRTGPQTQNRAQDAAQIGSQIVRGGRALHGDVPAMIGIGMDFLRSRGMSDTMAEQIVRQSTSRDPVVVNRAIAQISARYGPEAARGFRRLRLGSSTATALSAGAASQQQPRGR